MDNGTEYRLRSLRGRDGFYASVRINDGAGPIAIRNDDPPIGLRLAACPWRRPWTGRPVRQRRQQRVSRAIQRRAFRGRGRRITHRRLLLQILQRFWRWQRARPDIARLGRERCNGPVLTQDAAHVHTVRDRTVRIVASGERWVPPCVIAAAIE